MMQNNFIDSSGVTLLSTLVLYIATITLFKHILRIIMSNNIADLQNTVKLQNIYLFIVFFHKTFDKFYRL